MKLLAILPLADGRSLSGTAKAVPVEPGRKADAMADFATSC